MITAANGSKSLKENTHPFQNITLMLDILAVECIVVVMH